MDDNQHVKQGDLLAKLDTRDYEVALQRSQASLDQSKAQVLQAQAAVIQASAGVEQAQAQVAQARAQTTQAGAQYQVAGVNYGRNSALFTKDYPRGCPGRRGHDEEQSRRVQGRFRGRQGQRASCRGRVWTPPNPSSKAARRNWSSPRRRWKRAEASVEDAKLQLSYCWVLAPCDGRVSRKTVETGFRSFGGPIGAGGDGRRRLGAGEFQGNPARKRAGGPAGEDRIDACPKDHPLPVRVDSIQNGSGATYSLLPPDNATGNFTKIVQRVPVKIVFDLDPPDQHQGFRGSGRTGLVGNAED